MDNKRIRTKLIASAYVKDLESSIVEFESAHEVLSVEIISSEICKKLIANITYVDEANEE